jgi:hypothetical protein
MARPITVACRALVDHAKTPRGRASLYTFSIGVFLAIIFSISIIKTADQSHPIRDVFLNLAGALAIVGLVDFAIRMFEELAQIQDRDTFIAFFGRGRADGKYPAIFSSAKLSGRLLFPPHTIPNENVYPKGITHVISAEEVPPIADLDALFRIFGRQIEVQVDEFDKERKILPKEDLLSIGLGFNNVTKTLSKESGLLFEITYDEFLSKYKEPWATGDERTDDFHINLSPRGYRDPVRPAAVVGDKKEYALIARILRRGQVCIVCAGHTAYGTASALAFLSERWKDLFSQYGPEELTQKNMVALLSHQPDRREIGKLEELYFSLPGGDTEVRPPNCAP